jgi:hypothetical protein
VFGDANSAFLSLSAIDLSRSLSLPSDFKLFSAIAFFCSALVFHTSQNEQSIYSLDRLVNLQIQYLLLFFSNKKHEAFSYRKKGADFHKA